MGDRMTMQMTQMPDALSATRIDFDAMDPPKAPLAMPKQVLTPEPGAFLRAVASIPSRLLPGRQGLRRVG
jgi:hypothetical protein